MTRTEPATRRAARPADGTHRIQAPTLGAAAAILAAATLLRLWGLGSDSFWVDEIRAVLGPTDGPLLDGVREVFGPLDPPGQYVLADLVARMPLPLEVGGRLPAAIAGVIEVALAGLLARRVTGRDTTGLAAAALVAVAPFVVRYGQEARYYTMFSALHLGGWLLVLSIVDALRAGRPLGRLPVAFGAVTALSLYTHFFTWPVLVVQIGVLLVVARPDALTRLRSVAVPLGAAIALFSPWVVYAAAYWLDPNRPRPMTIRDPGAFDIGYGPETFARIVSWMLANDPGATLVVLAVLGLTAAAAVLGRGRVRTAVLAGTAYVATMIALLLVLSTLNGTFFAVRRTEFLVPVLFVGAALGIDTIATRLPTPVGRPLAVPVLTAVVGLTLLPHLHRVYEEDNMALRETFAHAEAEGLPITVGRFIEGRDAWYPVFVRYADAAGYDVTFDRVAGLDVRDEPAAGRRLWLVANVPDDPRFVVVAGNDRRDVSPVASDPSLGREISYGVYLLESTWSSTDELADQATLIARLPVAAEIGGDG